MPALNKILPHYTYEDYCNWEGRWELIDGIPFAMSPSPVPLHQWISVNIKTEFVNSIKKSGCTTCKVYDFIDVKISENTVLQPDALIVCGEIEKPFLDFPAALVVEILAPSTALKDRNSKYFIYEQQKIPYFLIVDVNKKEVEVYHLENGKYQLAEIPPATPYSFHLDKDCQVNILLDNIWT